MSVYVDPINQYATERSPRCFWPGSCHMYADTQEELHRMASAIGLQYGWFQNHPHLKHYDLTISKRALAVRMGAKEHTFHEAVAKWEELRK